MPSTATSELIVTGTDRARPRWRRRTGIALIATALLLLGGLLFLPDSSATVRVTIPSGSTFKQAADSLQRTGVVTFPILFRLYARIAGHDRSVRAGTYILARNSSWPAILDSLTRGRGVTENLTVPEGFSLAAIESLLVRRLDLHPDSVALATRDSSIRARLQVPAPSLEGYLFPDTYNLPVGTSASQAVRFMVEHFETVWDSTWNSRLAELSMTRHELVTLASIVEKEAILAHERPVISAVFHNRLRIGMPLQADPTVLYALGAHVDRVYLKDLEVQSPYNTYRNAGLPPGPIASPGLLSIQAALYPADVKYLYFVAHPEGHHEFRNTFAEHLIAKQRVQQIRDQSPGR